MKSFLFLLGFLLSAHDAWSQDLNKIDSAGAQNKVLKDASFQGGDISSFRNWVQLHLKYPESAVINGEQGRVVVEITINEEGKLENARIIKAVSPSLDQESLRVINKSPIWQPAICNGKPVKQTFTFPLIFALQ
jgi:TonB family protein